jgi:hypothetical protein
VGHLYIECPVVGVGGVPFHRVGLAVEFPPKTYAQRLHLKIYGEVFIQPPRACDDTELECLAESDTVLEG